MGGAVRTYTPTKPVAIRARHGGGKVHRSVVSSFAPKTYAGAAACHQTRSDMIRVAPGTKIGPLDACRHCWGATDDAILAAL